MEDLLPADFAVNLASEQLVDAASSRGLNNLSMKATIDESWIQFI
jgi:hypothetical protein